MSPKETKIQTLLNVLQSTVSEITAIINGPSVLTGIIGSNFQVTASSDDGNVAENVRDDSFETRWSAKGSGQTLTIELPDVSEVDSIQVAIHEGDKRKQKFDVVYPGENGAAIMIGSFETSGQTKGFESFTFPPIETKHISIVGNMNSTGEWNSFTGVRVNDPEAVNIQVPNQAPSPEPVPDPEGFETIKRLTFDNHPVGDYTDAMLKKDWGTGKLWTPNTTRIEKIGDSNWLVSHYPKGTWGRGGGLNQVMEFMRGMEVEEVHLSYSILFQEGFDFALGGKLLGFGFGLAKTMMSGGDMPDPKGGTTVRMMWVAGGRMKLYVYNHTKTEQWGSDLGTGLIGQIVPGKKHKIEMKLKANTLGKNDGVIEVKQDGKLLVSVKNVSLRIPTSPQYIESLTLCTFMGGDKKEFAPDHNQWMAMGDIEVRVKA